jgi:copper transport protein
MRHRRDLIAAAAAAMLVALFSWAALAPAPASAHAYLTRSQPPAGASLVTSPSRLLLTFSEDVVARFSKVQITDADLRVMPGVLAPRAVPGHPAQLLVRVTKRLPTGLYTVNMLILSVDGHQEGQSWKFGVRVVVPPGDRTTGGARLAQNSAALSAGTAAGRWLLYCGLAVLVGAAGISWLAFGGAIPRGGRLLLRGAWLLAAAGAFTVLMVEQRVVSAPSLLPLLQTEAGRTLGEQAVAVAVAGVALLALELYPHRITLAVLGVAAAVAMLFHVLSGHAGAAPDLRALNVMTQWIHLIAVGLWFGGLLWLLLGIRDMERGPRNRAVQRFSTLAGVALAVVVVTGTFRAATEIGSLTTLDSTTYGMTLLVKLALVAIVAAMGALNRFRMVPALAGTDAAVQPFTYNSEGEITLSAAILAVTAVLVGLAP